MDFKDWLITVAYSVQLIGIMFLVYRHFADSDAKTDKKMGISAATCDLKHKGIDEKFSDIFIELRSIKENHLSHIERDINLIKVDQAREISNLSGKVDTLIGLSNKNLNM